MAGKSAATRKRGRPTGEGAAALEELILETSLDVFRKHGYDGASIELIAASCNTSKHSIYRRYSGKEKLFVAALALFGRRIVERLATVEAPEQAPLVKLRMTIMALLEIAVSRSAIELYRLTISVVPRIPELRDQSLATERCILEILEPLIRRAQDEGLIRQGDSGLLTRQIYYFSVSHVWTHALIGDGCTFDHNERKQLFEANWALLLDGVRPRNQGHN